MRKTYPTLGSEHEIKYTLREMGIDVLEPASRSEEATAEALGDFAHFVLHEEKGACLAILEGDLQRGGGSVGELQGGSDDYSIYRASIPIDDCGGELGGRKTGNAAMQLLEMYNNRNGRGRSNTLTAEEIKQYMLQMCDRRTHERNGPRYTSLGNLMFILQFGGPTDGQVRHIDNMIPNVQACLYMSHKCPSTVVYAVDDGDGDPVTDGASLLEFWGQNKGDVPELLKDILTTHGDRQLNSKWYTKYFGWSTINLQLECFGKLYQPVAYQLGLQTEPGTTLLAGGNEIHAGPPTTESRMFAFAIGIPEQDGASDNEELVEGSDGENDGEVQYSPVLFHIDFCCVLFAILDYEHGTPENEGMILQAKFFLVEVLVELIDDYPMKEYLLQIDEERVGVRIWLENALTRLENKQSTGSLVEEAVESDQILYTPDIVKRRSKKKKKTRPRRNEITTSRS